MDHHDLTGYYTYHSLLNRPEPVDDLDKLRFAQAELYLYVAPDGTITGTLAFPAEPAAPQKEFMDLTGRVTCWSPPTLELEGFGRAGTGTDSFHYKYQGSLAPQYAEAIQQRPALMGTVLRASPHGNAPAGLTASFIAVKRDYLPPRQIRGVELIPEAVAVMASRRHRLQHAVWHTVRIRWHALTEHSAAVTEIARRGWWPERPPFLETGGLDLQNAAGEDFLFMHRKMIQMLHEAYAKTGAQPPGAWASLPSADVPQTVYRRLETESGPVFVLDPDASGFMVPPPAIDVDVDRMLKSPAFLSGVMRPLANLFRSPRLLSAMTLGELGNLLEFTIHGWMHIRWTYTIYDPATGEPIGRSSLYDIDPRWDDPSNDDLGDFYSSHVHPLFWRLHGWIDEVINAWATANIAAITTTIVDGVPWFQADGRLVKVSDPFYWPSGGHGKGHPHQDDSDIRDMEEVMKIMEAVLEPPVVPTDTRLPARRMTAKEAFREALLSISVPDLLQP